MSEIIVIQESTDVVEVSTPGVPGPIGVGVPAGGTTGQVLKKDSDDDYDTSWQAPGAAPNANQVAFTPAGNLSADDVQEAIEELDTEKASTASVTTVASDLAAHLADTSDAHDASAISILDAANDFTATDVEGALAELQSDAEADASALSDHIADTSAAHAASAVSVSSTTLSGTGTDVQAVFEEIDNLLDDHSARHENGGADEISIAGLDGTPTELANHLADASDAHDASAVSVVPFGSIAATDVQAALEEVFAEASGGASALTDLTDVTGTPDTGEAPVWDGDSFELTNVATQAELDAHLNDGADAHDASAISVLDTAAQFGGTDVEAVLAEIQDNLDAHLADAADAHDASAVSVDSTTLSGTGTTVQAVFEELDNLLDDHSSRHENGGADEISVAGLSGELADAQPVTVRKNTGSDVGTRSRLNFIEGSNVTLTVSDDAGSDEVDITIAAASGGSATADDESLVLHVNLLAI